MRRMSTLDEIVFDGGEGQCERFIRLIRKAAFSHGKLEDSKWVAMFASTCFEGKALRWYSALDAATKTDWNLMEPALLTEFSGPVLSSQPEETAPLVEQESGIPTPAAAPPPPPSASEEMSSRPASPTSYEPAPTPAAAPPPPSPSPLNEPPLPPSRESSSQGKPGPPPPPPPRNSSFKATYQTGSGFRPPPRHPSANTSSASKPNEPTPGLYGSYIPTNSAARPPPPPRNSSFTSQQFQEQPGYGAPNSNESPREEPEGSRMNPEHLDGESTINQFNRERRPYSTKSGPTVPSPGPRTSPPDNPNVDFFVAPDGTTYDKWNTNTYQPSWKPNDPPKKAAPPPPPNYNGHPEPQSDLPPQPQPPPPPPPRRDNQFPPPPPRRNPTTAQQQGPQFPGAGPVPPQFTGPGVGVPPQFTGPGVGIPPQFTGGDGTGIPPQFTGAPWPGFQQQYGTGYPAPSPFGGPSMARRGRIRVIDPSGVMYWVRESLNWFGGFKRTSKMGEAAVVLWDPVNEPGRLKLLRPINNHLWVGLTWATVPKGASPALGRGSKDQADLAAITELPSGTISSASHREGFSQVAVWFMNSDMTMEARIPTTDGQYYPLDVAVGSGTKWIWLVADFDTFALSNVGQIKSSLAFEPI